MLESIVVKNVASYDANGIRIDNLRKVNFIYGANGCGKTTISKLIENPRDASHLRSQLNFRGQLEVKRLVYNKTFRENNFGKGKMDGVFTLGQATKEDIEAIEKWREELKQIKEEIIKKKDTLDKLMNSKADEENEFKEVIWRDIYKEHEHNFKDAFRGFLTKDKFKEKLLEEYLTNKTDLLTLETLTNKANTLLGDMPSTLPMLPTIEYAGLSEVETNKIWIKKIVGKADIAIAALIQRLNINDWVNEGRGYFQDDNRCPFCQEQTITDQFRKQIEEYFDQSFTEDINTAKVLSEQYNLLAKNVENLLAQIENNEKSIEDSKLDIQAFSALINTLSGQFRTNLERLSNKAKEPSRSLELLSTKEQLERIDKLVKDCNSEIKAHNALVNDYGNQRNKLVSSIWRYIIEHHRATIEAHVKKNDNFNKGIKGLIEKRNALLEDYQNLEVKIQDANKNVTSVQPSVDEINRILNSYGFTNFKIVPSQREKNKYQIEREDGTIAESTLSEGEASFITFLYYLQLAKGSTQEESITEERILVIDDPISSLDSNILFVVSSLIKEIIKNIKSGRGNIMQLILLTHNVYFHKEVSFIDGRTRGDGDTHYWILRKSKNSTTIQAYEMDNPIHSSYELLWKELTTSDRNSAITIQNTMRRIIESYFKMLGRYADDDLIKRFETAQEQEICRSLVCWINDGSHGLPDDMYIEQQDAIADRYFEVFKNIFTIMGHKEHYNMMCRTPVDNKDVHN